MIFNEDQKQAIEFYKGACSVNAGAGSGKTAVLIERIRNLVNTYKVKEDDILAVSFTRNTANELKEKLNKIGFYNVKVGTFHSICGEILTREGYDLNKKPIQFQIENLFNKNTYSNKVKLDDIMSFISYQKSHLKTYNDEFVFKDSNYNEIELRNYFEQYEKFKIQNNMYDLDDWLIECYKLLKDKKWKHDPRFKFILVDENQDCNLVKNLLIKELCYTDNVFVVGDFRQSIYGFNGAIPEIFMDFDKRWDNATIINLKTNYRSNENIVNKSNNFIKQYYGDYRYYKDSIANIKDKADIGVHTYYDKKEEAIGIANKVEELLKNGEKANEIAVLYRLNSDSPYIENELRSRNILYDISNGSSFFKRKEVNGIMSYLRLIDNPHDNDAFLNIFKLRNQPLKFFSNKILQKIQEFSGRNNLSLYESFIELHYDKSWQRKNVKDFQNKIDRLRLQKNKDVTVYEIIDNIYKLFHIDEYIKDNFDDEELEDRLNSIDILKSFIKKNNLSSFINYVYNNLQNNDKKVKNNSIRLMTIHKSKGLEFNNVFIIGIEDDKFPYKKSDILEEARLFYVGITRPKKRLILSQIQFDNKFISEYVGKEYELYKDSKFKNII